jgi:hypothetical protein
MWCRPPVTQWSETPGPDHRATQANAAVVGAGLGLLVHWAGSPTRTRAGSQRSAPSRQDRISRAGHDSEPAARTPRAGRPRCDAGGQAASDTPPKRDAPDLQSGAPWGPGVGSWSTRRSSSRPWTPLLWRQSRCSPLERSRQPRPWPSWRGRRRDHGIRSKVPSRGPLLTLGSAPRSSWPACGRARSAARREPDAFLRPDLVLEDFAQSWADVVGPLAGATIAWLRLHPAGSRRRQWCGRHRALSRFSQGHAQVVARALILGRPHRRRERIRPASASVAGRRSSARRCPCRAEAAGPQSRDPT